MRNVLVCGLAVVAENDDEPVPLAMIVLASNTCGLATPTPDTAVKALTRPKPYSRFLPSLPYVTVAEPIKSVVLCNRPRKVVAVIDVFIERARAPTPAAIGVAADVLL